MIIISNTFSRLKHKFTIFVTKLTYTQQVMLQTINKQDMINGQVGRLTNLTFTNYLTFAIISKCNIISLTYVYFSGSLESFQSINNFLTFRWRQTTTTTCFAGQQETFTTLFQDQTKNPIPVLFFQRTNKTNLYCPSSLNT